jgi:hypothetical protein
MGETELGLGQSLKLARDDHKDHELPLQCGVTIEPGVY